MEDVEFGLQPLAMYSAVFKSIDNRKKPKNMMLVGMISGPKAPKDLQPYLDMSVEYQASQKSFNSIVDDLEEGWKGVACEDGFYPKDHTKRKFDLRVIDIC